METLFAKVSLLLTVTMILGALGTLCGRQVRSLGAMIGLGLAFILGAIAVLVVAQSNPMVGIGLLFGWAFVSGLFIGPVVQIRAESLGWQTVFGCFAGTAGVMAACGSIGLFSGADFSSMGTYLGFALFGLIIVGVVGIFWRMSRTVNIAYSLVGMVIFAGYFVYDFFRLGRSENTWPKAIELTMSIYLDFINFFLYLLQFLDAVNSK
ncbi:MAG: Bax inhibitor-1 family protein [Candidatus Melainabacteria bacterium]|nr:Bax inhibitor-1 family protein [Candidatus Melainabacteria bacterium]